ncbi:hypothetical protein F2P81_015473 [Scophthalmus maximus]|uniref:Uncharacterized protein n=1 Tax=Scophthalmus maximus TaxID=52904 RepID=A0A6A4SGB3_SCOMX|nr:hypothetical protein F2P81_015473 [Scophthalmus maximus]
MDHVTRGTRTRSTRPEHELCDPEGFNSVITDGNIDRTDRTSGSRLLSSQKKRRSLHQDQTLFPVPPPHFSVSYQNCPRTNQIK